MKKIIPIAASWFFILTCLGADNYPSVYDQTIKDNVDHLIIRVEKQNDRQRPNFGTTNVVVIPLSGERHADTVFIPVHMIETKDRKYLEPGNVIHVQNRTNFTFTTKEKYPTLRKISAYTGDYYITDDEYEVTLIEVYTDAMAVGPEKGKKYPRATISLKRLKDKASFGSISLEDFDYKTSVHEGDIVRLNEGGKLMVMVKHKPYPWEKQTNLSMERIKLNR